jgi:hypothetical protein
MFFYHPFQGNGFVVGHLHGNIDVEVGNVYQFPFVCVAGTGGGGGVMDVTVDDIGYPGRNGGGVCDEWMKTKWAMVEEYPAVGHVRYSDNHGLADGVESQLPHHPSGFIMVTEDEDFLPGETVDDGGDGGRVSDLIFLGTLHVTYVTKVVDDILRSNAILPSTFEVCIHLGCSGIGARAVVDDVLMPEVSVGDDPFFHNFSPQNGQNEMYMTYWWVSLSYIPHTSPT